jgi:pimeloyl-ACP methyl ester carboxylesterase
VRRFVVLLLAASVLLSGCLWNTERRLEEGALDEMSNEAFYSVPATEPAGKPGEIVRSLPILSAPLGADAWRVIYHTTDVNGEDVLSSAIVAVPEGPSPTGGTPIVSWGHPTTGAAQGCAPSVLIDPFLMMTGLSEYIAAGYAMVATDYPGMAVRGDSSYLIGVTEGNAMLDAARAARALSPGLGTDVVLWGHSQGGQAALFAGQQAAAGYAPDLDIVAVAAAAPAADLTELMTDDIDFMEGVTITSYAFPSYEAAYADRYTKADLTAVLTDDGAAAVDELASICLLTEGEHLHSVAKPLIGNFVRTNPATTEPWQTLLKENSAGATPITVPVFIGQGLADTTVDPSSTKSYVEHLCSTGENVTFREFDGVSHLLAGSVSVVDVLPWLRGIRAGTTPAGTC